AERDDLAGAQIDWRFHSLGDASRCSRDNHVTWVKRHEPAEIAHNLGDAKDHVRSRAVLAPDAVHIEPEPERLGVWDLISCDEPRSDRPERVAALALGPLTGALALQRPFRHIIGEEVTRHMFEGTLLGH